MGTSGRGLVDIAADSTPHIWTAYFFTAVDSRTLSQLASGAKEEAKGIKRATRKAKGG